MLPDTVHATVLARVDSLPERERTVIEYASVAGRTVRSEAVAAVVSLPADVIDDALGSLAERGLVSRGAGDYTFRAFALAASTFWIHVHATIQALRRSPGRFVVTPKRGASSRQPRAVAPTLAVMMVLVVAAVVGLHRNRDPATLNNVAFTMLHLTVLAVGVRPALVRSSSASARRDEAATEVAA